MEVLEIEGTFMTPHVVLNPTTNEFILKGNSRPENPLAFFKPIFNWFENYLNVSENKLTLSIALDYFNTSTSKILLDLFEFFENFNEKETKVHVIWHYQSDDEDMKEAGEELFDLVSISGELKAI